MMIDIDHPIIDRGVEALFGQHPERGGMERRQAVFTVFMAMREGFIEVLEEANTSGQWSQALDLIRSLLEEQIAVPIPPGKILVFDFVTGKTYDVADTAGSVDQRALGIAVEKVSAPYSDFRQVATRAIEAYVQECQPVLVTEEMARQAVNVYYNDMHQTARPFWLSMKIAIETILNGE